MKYIEVAFIVCLCIVFYTYLGYGILLWLLVKIKRFFSYELKTQQYEAEDFPEVTLLIAAYNEELVVDEKMSNTHNLNYPKGKLSIVWVTDGSNDGTNEKLSRYKDVTVLYEPQRQGKTAALNRSIKYIASPIVVFTDANTMLNRDAIVNIAKCFLNNPRVGCVAGEKRIADKERSNASTGGEGLYWKYESALKRLDSELCTAVGAAGELFAIKRELYENMGNDTLLDDFMLSMQIAAKGYKIEYCSNAYAEESGSANMQEEEKRKVRIAAGGLQSVWRLRKLLNIFKYGTMSFQYISHRVLRWTITPILMFLMLPVNIILLVQNPQSCFYIVMLVLQVLFYMSALWGYALSKKSIKNKFLYVPYYFLFMNVNVIKGFFYLRQHRGSGAWEKSARA